MKNIVFLLFMVLPFWGQAKGNAGSTPEYREFPNFSSKFISARNVVVMLPPGYHPEKRYPVLYMHDGQMLFDASKTWNKKEWGVDETIVRLIQEKKIQPVIVVGIWNTLNRRLEYMPNEPEKEIETMKRQEGFQGKLVSDEYLKFIVQELKPMIDTTFSTLPDRAHTFIMGSSMGGLISCYAISEYPGVFGGAACMSTHWPALDGIFLKYVKENLPNPATHKIYFDHGTGTLDSLYQPYQDQVDRMMEERGYTQGTNWMSRKFEGAIHDEIAWGKRLHIPLQFLLPKQ